MGTGRCHSIHTRWATAVFGTRLVVTVYPRALLIWEGILPMQISSWEQACQQDAPCIRLHCSWRGSLTGITESPESFVNLYPT